MVERRCHIAHSFGHTAIEVIGVHVPDKFGGHGNKPTAVFAQPSCQQQQLAQRFGVVGKIPVVLAVLPNRCWMHQGSRVVACDGLGIFQRQVKGLADAFENRIECRVAGGREIFCPGLVGRGLQPIQLRQQPASVCEPMHRQVQLHVLLQLATGAWHERAVAGPQQAGVAVHFEVLVEAASGVGLRTGIDHLWKQQGVCGQTRLRVAVACDPRIQGTQIGSKGVAMDERFDVVLAIPGGKRPYDVDLVCQCGDFREGAAKRNSGNRCLKFSGGAANSGRSGHLGIEGFGLTGATVHEQKNDRAVLDEMPQVGRAGGCFQQIWQRQTA